MKRVLAVTVTISAMISSANAQENASCVDLIRASRQVSSIIESQNKTEDWARTFCKEYYASASSSRSQEFGAAYSGLSASFGGTRASEQAVAEKYCDAQSSNKVQDNLYKRYIDVIAPGALEAYSNCVTNLRGGLKYTLGEVTANRLPVFIDYDPPQANATIVLDFSADGAATCNWNPRGRSNSLTLVEPNTVTLAPSDGVRTLFSSNPQVLKLKKGQAKLICDRTDTTKPVSVEIITADANYKPFSFRWVEYQGQIPAPAFGAINREIQAFMNSLNGAVLAFNSEKCPDGWEPYKEAYGRFLRGIDPTGSKDIDPGGRRKPGTTQEDAFRRHAHDTRLGYSQGGAGPNYAMPYMSPTNTPEKLPFSFEGNDETRPKNVAVLYCLRK